MTNAWHPKFGGPPWVVAESFAFHKKGDVEYKPPEPSAQETELLNLLMDQIKQQDEIRTQQLEEAKQRKGLISEFLDKEYSTDPLSEDQKARLNEIESTFLGTRKQAVTDQATEIEKQLRTKFANQGILDSSVSSEADIKVGKESMKLIDQAAKEASLLKFGTEQDIRNAALSERLQKIGVLSSLSDPAMATNILGSLTGQRQQYANTALQVALSNAQNSGGFGQLLGSTLGMGLGALLAAPTGGMSILGGASLGGALGGGAGGLARF